MKAKGEGTVVVGGTPTHVQQVVVVVGGGCWWYTDPRTASVGGVGTPNLRTTGIKQRPRCLTLRAATGCLSQGTSRCKT